MDPGVLASANELFEARHYPSVIAVASDALEDHPECVPLLVLRARSHIALRRNLDAQADLRDIIRLDPQCALAYRLLGELAARRDENESAAIFFREALRLDPSDREATDWLQICITSRSAAVANKPPAPATAAGRFPSARGPLERARTATEARSISAPARPSQRLARGTRPPNAETVLAPQPPTEPFVRASAPQLEAERRAARPALGSEPKREPVPMVLVEPKREPVPMVLVAPRAQTSQPRPMTRTQLPEPPGFGDYLVTSGILSRERLRAAQAYQRSMRVQLSTAIVTLGLATPQRIEWAVVAHQSQLAHDRHH